MYDHRSAALAGLLLLATAGPLGAQAAEWPTWRGPSENGIAGADARPPLEWSETKNVRWKVELPGLGNSSPVVRGDFIYLTSAIDLSAEDPARAQPGPPEASGPHRFVVLALERRSGKIVCRPPWASRSRTRGAT